MQLQDVLYLYLIWMFDPEVTTIINSYYVNIPHII